MTQHTHTRTPNDEEESSLRTLVSVVVAAVAVVVVELVDALDSVISTKEEEGGREGARKRGRRGIDVGEGEKDRVSG